MTRKSYTHTHTPEYKTVCMYVCAHTWIRRRAAVQVPRSLSWRRRRRRMHTRVTTRRHDPGTYDATDSRGAKLATRYFIVGQHASAHVRLIRLRACIRQRLSTRSPTIIQRRWNNNNTLLCESICVFCARENNVVNIGIVIDDSVIMDNVVHRYLEVYYWKNFSEISYRYFSTVSLSTSNQDRQVV